MAYEVRPFYIKNPFQVWTADVKLIEGGPWIKIAQSPRGKIIHNNNLVTLINTHVNNMGADKTRSTSNQYFHHEPPRSGIRRKTSWVLICPSGFKDR